MTTLSICNLTKNRNLFKSLWQLLLLAFPVLGAHLIEALIPFINTAQAASLGENALAAAGLVGTTFLALMGFCWGVISAVGIIAAQSLGEKVSPQKIGLILKTGLLVSFLLSIPVMTFFHFLKPIWIYFDQDPAVAQYAQDYFDGLKFAVFADLAKFAIFQFAIACGQPRIGLIANLISIPFIYFFNSILIHFFGITGIGISTSITYWLVFLVSWIYLLKAKEFKDYFKQKFPLKECLSQCLAQLRLGAPIGAMYSIELLFFVVFALLMGYISATTLAANQIAMQWMWLTIMFAQGLTEAVTILVAKARGANEYRQAAGFIASGIFFSGTCMLIIGAIYCTFPKLLISVDLSIHENPELTKLAINMIILCALYQIFDNIRIVISGALRGLGDSQFPMWISSAAFWLIALPIGYFLGLILNLGGPGLWGGLIFAVLFSVVLQYQKLKKMLKMECKSNS